MEHLVVRDFGPITEVDIDLKRVNVFIGGQGVGKSTIAKLLSCCRDYYLFYCVAHNNNMKRFMFIFSAYGIQTYFHKDTYIEYTNEEGWTLTYSGGKFSLSHKAIVQEQIPKALTFVIAEGLKDACEKLGNPISPDISKKELDNIFKSNFQLIYSNLRTSFYCPAERGLTGILSNSLATLGLSNIPIPQTLLEFMSFFEKARNAFPRYEVPFMKLSYSFSGGKDSITDRGAKIDFRHTSSGIQSSLPLLMVIDYCLNQKYFSSFTVEEPELNLFPTNQRHMLRALISKTNLEQSKLGSWTITTHSPYLLSVLNISLLGGIIANKFPEARKELFAVLPEEYLINPEDIAVYELSASDTEAPYCKSILSPKTGLIQANYLDSVSGIISAEFNTLYKQYVSLLKQGNRES